MKAAPKATRIPIDRLPVVDIAPWYGGDRVGRMAVAGAVHDAFRDVGFMYVSGHRVPAEYTHAAFAAARAFFALPEDEKNAIHYRHRGYRRGYLPILSESSDPAAKGDLKEAFDCRLGTIGGVIDNIWPQRPEGFRHAVENHLGATRALAGDLLAMLAVAFDMPDNWFDDKIDHPISTMRLLRYPSQQAPTSSEILGIGAHCDYECLTVLAQDQVGGLQVQSADGIWIEAPPLPGTFVVNVGEMLARWTNDLLVATAHRVVNVSGAERYSIPTFFATNPDIVIEPLASCVSTEHSSRYPAVRAGDYLDARIQEIYLDRTGAAEAQL